MKEQEKHNNNITKLFFITFMNSYIIYTFIHRQKFCTFQRVILAIILHSTHYLFSNWPKTYSEFSKSAPGMSSSCRLYNNHVKVLGNHAMYDCHAWFLWVVMSSLCTLCSLPSVTKTWLPHLLWWPSKTSKSNWISLFTIVMLSSVKFIYYYLLSRPAFIQFFTYCLMLGLFCQSNYVPLICIFLGLRNKLLVPPTDVPKQLLYFFFIIILDITKTSSNNYL